MTDTTTIERGRWYPAPAPALDGETDDTYTNRLLGTDGTDRRPYDHPRNRQCSIGYHLECSDPAGERCKCPCHAEPDNADTENVNVEAAERLADLYSLPDVTGYRVMHHAQQAIQAGDVTTLNHLQVTLGTLYDSHIGAGFAIDVANLLGYANLTENSR